MFKAPAPPCWWGRGLAEHGATWVVYPKTGYIIDRGKVIGPQGFRHCFTGVELILKLDGVVFEPIEIVR
jgi:hypothetical protein